MWKAYTSVISSRYYMILPANRSRVCAVNGCGVRVLLDGCPSVRVRLAVWWDRQDEIDVMAVDNASDAAIVGECKISAMRRWTVPC